MTIIPDPKSWHEKELLALAAQANNALFESLAQVVALADPGLKRKQDHESGVIQAHGEILKVAQDAVRKALGNKSPKTALEFRSANLEASLAAIAYAYGVVEQHAQEAHDELDRE